MTLRHRLLVLITATVAVTVILVTWTVAASARSAFATIDAQRTAALVQQFQRHTFCSSLHRCNAWERAHG